VVRDVSAPEENEMKVRNLMLGLMLTGAMAFAQSTTPQTAPQTPPVGTPGAGTEQGMQTPPRRGMRGGMGMQGMGQMHEQHMQQAKEQLAKMHQLLDQMKSNVSKMDQKDQAYAQANAQMWEMMVSHLDMMVQRMSEMKPGAGPGAMRHRHMGGPGAGMPGSTGPTQPSTPEAKPPKQ
jgi:hypothetical protein